MEEGDYLMMDPASEVKENVTRGKNDGNEVVEEGSSPPLDLDPNEVIEADEETLPYAEEDWQKRTPNRWSSPRSWNQIFRLRYRLDRVTGQDSRRNTILTEMTYVDRMDLKKIVEELVGLEEIAVSQDIDIVDDRDEEWIDDRSKPEVEFNDEHGNPTNKT